MAIYSFNAKIISRKAGQSAVATAAYNARDKLMDERTGEIKHYYAVDGSLIHSGIYTPDNAPEWAHDRAQLWNHAEAAENRKDSQIARNFIVALPHELTDEQRRFAIQDFVKENFTRKGYAADLNIHAPDKDGDDRNYHAHILVTDRKLEPDGFAASKSERQQTETQRKEELEHLRQSWEKIGNRHLERWGHEPTLDRRTLEAQGIDREPTIHKGVDVTAMERRGVETDRGNEAQQIEARNSELGNLKNEAVKISQAIEAEEQKQQREKAGASPQTIDPTLYDRGGMVSQQRDANAHHEARQNALDDKQAIIANDNKPETEKDYNSFGAWVKRGFFGGDDELTEAKKEKFRDVGNALNERGEEKAEPDAITRNLNEHNERKRQTESAENYKTLTEGGDSSSASSRVQTPDEIKADKLERARARLERLSEEQDSGNDNREMGEKARERTRER